MEMRSNIQVSLIHSYLLKKQVRKKPQTIHSKASKTAKIVK